MRQVPHAPRLHAPDQTNSSHDNLYHKKMQKEM
jgi:hypothetical protein